MRCAGGGVRARQKARQQGWAGQELGLGFGHDEREGVDRAGRLALRMKNGGKGCAGAGKGGWALAVGRPQATLVDVGGVGGCTRSGAGREGKVGSSSRQWH